MKGYLLLALLAGAAAQPALAQEPFGPPYRGRAPHLLIDELERRIEHDFRFGIIEREDWRRLLSDALRLRRVEYEYGRDGFSSWERSDLARQVDRLRGDVMDAEENRFGEGTIVPRPDPPPYYTGRRDRGFERDDDLFGDRSYDRDEDRSRDDRDDGADDAVDDDAGFEGGGDDTGEGRDDGQVDGDDDSGEVRYEPGGGYPDALRVGDRAPVNLGLLPPELRSRYPDGRGFYYRYWNGTIYQIDDDTGTIRWIGQAASN